MANTSENGSSVFTLADDEWREFVDNNIPFTVYLSVLLVLGTVGNIATIIIYATRKPPSNCRTFILLLAVVGLLSCTIGIPEYIYKQRRKFSYGNDVICKAFVFIHFFLSSYCVLLLDLIAVERYLKTCKMFGRQLSRRMARLFCVGLGFASVAIAVYPALYVYGVEEVVGKLSREVGYKCTLPDVSKGRIFFGMFGFLNVFGIGFSVTFYLLIYRMLKEHKKENQVLLKMTPRPLQPRTISRDNVSTSQSSLHQVRDIFRGNKSKIKSRSVDEIHRLMNKYDHKPTLNSSDFKTSDGEKNTKRNQDDDYNDDEDDDFGDNQYTKSCTNIQNGGTRNDSDTAISGARSSGHSSRAFSKMSIVSASDIMIQRIKTLNKSVKMTLIFFVATVASYLTAIPYIACMCIASVSTDLFNLILVSLRPFSYIFLFLHLLNYVINPFVYCVLDNDFRNGIKSLGKGGLKRNNFSTESTSI